MIKKLYTINFIITKFRLFFINQIINLLLILKHGISMLIKQEIVIKSTIEY